MATTYQYPGVYIEEITGPGVIAGVGTSTAAFIGPAARGPMVPTTITTFDDFQRLYGRAGDGWPYLFVHNRWYYLGHGVEGFFTNGGTRAVILRVGTATAARWRLQNRANQDVLNLEAREEGLAGNALTVDVEETGLTGSSAPVMAYAEADVQSVNDARLEITYAAGAHPLVVGDTVEVFRGTPQAASERRVITAISTDANGKIFADLNLAWVHPRPATGIRTAAIEPGQARFRLKTPLGSLQAGSIIRVDAGTTATPDVHHAVVARVDRDGFVELRQPLFQPQTGGWTNSIPLRRTSPTRPTRVETSDFKLTVNRAGVVVEFQDGLSLDPFHAGHVQSKVFSSIRVLQSIPPPTTTPQNVPIRNLRLKPVTGAQRVDGTADDLTQINLQTYKDALTKLKDVDDVNLVCIPDAANDLLIQQAALNHCETDMKDRIAVIDVPFNSAPDPTARAHRAAVSSDSGFAALYYPWLLVPEPVEPALPRPAQPRTLPIPACGHIAGVMARTDEAFGVHFPPANTDVRGVMGLERVLSDREQGLINLEGVNALRIFPGEGRVVVWGARTTAPKTRTDWTYVNVRRLLLYIEESIQEGIRWAVFKPNDFGLWQSLKRTIGSFLERVWKDGGLVGLKREQAYQVRIDEGLNPPDEIALGRLHIEIKVAPVRPAEFIIVRIGLWDGGAQVTES